MSGIITNVKNHYTKYKTTLDNAFVNQTNSQSQEISLILDTPMKRKDFIKSSKSKSKLQLLSAKLPFLLEPNNVFLIVTISLLGSAHHLKFFQSSVSCLINCSLSFNENDSVKARRSQR